MAPELKKFIQDNKALINQNSKESWKQVYDKIPHEIAGEFTQTLLGVSIDPASVMGYIPSYYLRNSNIAKYKISDNVTSIGHWAFAGCKNLTNSITIPDSVTSIGEFTFQQCYDLTSVTFASNSSLTTIGECAFAWCYNLRNIIIPDSVTSIGGLAFHGCTSLKEIKFKGTKKQAMQLGIGNRSNKSWREKSPIKKIICSDGVIEL